MPRNSPFTVPPGTLTYPALLCATVPRPTLPYLTSPYPTLPYPTLHHPTLTYSSLPYPTLSYPFLLYSTTLLYPTLLCSTLLYPYPIRRHPFQTHPFYKFLKEERSRDRRPGAPTDIFQVRDRGFCLVSVLGRQGHSPYLLARLRANLGNKKTSSPPSKETSKPCRRSSRKTKNKDKCSSTHLDENLRIVL